MRFTMFTEGGTALGETHHRRYWDVIEEAVFAEEMGFDTWGMSEHHFSPDVATMSSPEAVLTAVAMRTSRIRLRYMSRLTSFVHPVLVAEQLNTTDILSNGRVEMATARGNNIRQLDGFALPLDDTRGRSEEALELIVKAVSDDYFTHDGEYWGKIPARRLSPKGVQEPHPPLWKICQSVSSAVDAAQKGLGMITSDLYLGWQTLEDSLAAYHAVPEEDVSPVGRYANRRAASAAMSAYCAETTEEAIERAQKGAALSFAREIIHDVYAQLADRSAEYSEFHKFKELRDNSITIEWLREHTPTVLIGDPDYCIAQIKRHQEMGSEEIIMRIDGDSHQELMRNIEWFGRYVIPHFKNSKGIVHEGALGMVPDDPFAKPYFEQMRIKEGRKY